MLKYFVANLETHKCYCWFQQVGTISHAVSETMHFPGIQKACSPDLLPFNLFLWGYVKEIVSA